jgi:hypothetical protein
VARSSASQRATSLTSAYLPRRFSIGNTGTGTVPRDNACRNASMLGYPSARHSCVPVSIGPYCLSMSVSNRSTRALSSRCSFFMTPSASNRTPPCNDGRTQTAPFPEEKRKREFRNPIRRATGLTQCDKPCSDVGVTGPRCDRRTRKWATSALMVSISGPISANQHSRSNG